MSTISPKRATFTLGLMATLASATPSLAQGVSVERGDYLVQTIMGCGNCHTPMGPEGPVMSQDLAGRLVEEIDAFTAIAPNITPASRIADWSDAELGRAIREGIRPDGTVIGPPMPFAVYRAISDDDLASIVAYLRTVPEVEAEIAESEYRIPLPPSYGPPITEPVIAPDPADTVQYGEYLVALGHCMECHSPMSPQGPDLGAGFGRGGAEFHGPWGISVAANLTNHPDGLANHTDDEIKAMITRGVRPDGSRMNPPMGYGYFARMTNDDLEAIVAYLRTIPGQPDP